MNLGLLREIDISRARISLLTLSKILKCSFGEVDQAILQAVAGLCELMKIGTEKYIHAYLPIVCGLHARLAYLPKWPAYRPDWPAYLLASLPACLPLLPCLVCLPCLLSSPALPANLACLPCLPCL